MPPQAGQNMPVGLGRVCLCVPDATAISKSKYLPVTFETKVTRFFFFLRVGGRGDGVVTQMLVMASTP